MLPEFTNEPLSDFSKPENRAAIEAALEKVKGEFGREYPIVIGGARITGLKTFDSINPSHKTQFIGRFQKGSPSHVEQAVEAGTKAFETWKRAPLEQRAGLLLKAAELLRQRKHEFSAVMIYEVGKTWAEAGSDFATGRQVVIGGIADGIVGVDIWRNRAISIDYFAGLVTYQKEGIHRELMTVFSYGAEPMVQLSVRGETISAIVDTTSPDTLVLPRNNRSPGRATARITLAGVDFGDVDIRYADVSAPRIGNRLLSKFLISIDYGRRVVGLWRDPRN